MSEYDRQFVRRRITWKIKNFTQVNVEKYGLNEGLMSPLFAVNLKCNKSEWRIDIRPNCEENGKKYVSVYLVMKKAEFRNFTATFSLNVLKPDGQSSKRISFTKKKFAAPTDFGWSNCLLHQDLFNQANPLLEDHVLTLQFSLELLEDDKNEAIVPSKQCENYEKLINNEKFSDFAFVCSDGEKVLVNQCNVAVQCQAFAAMIDAEMKESKSKQAVVEDIDSETMLELLRYIYSGKVDGIDEIDDKLLAAANKYGIEDLKLICVSSLMENLYEDNVFETLVLADLYKQQHLKENCIDFIKCNYDAVKGAVGWKQISIDLYKEVVDSLIENHIQIAFESDALLKLSSLV